MSGFLILGALYVGLWALLLAPGAVVMFRRTEPLPFPDDDPDPSGWARQACGELATRSRANTVDAADVPVLELGKRGRLPDVSSEAYRVRGSLEVPEGVVIAVGLVIQGDLHVGAEARLLAPAWVKGDVVLEAQAVTAALVVEGTLTLATEARVDGAVRCKGQIDVGEGAEIEGVATSDAAITVAPGALVGSALAPSVRGAPLSEDVELYPRSDVEPIDADDWDTSLDPILAELWTTARLEEIVSEIEERTGAEVRQAQALRRGRRLGLLQEGVPRRPRFLGRRPAWVLTLERVRVGADLRIAEGTRIGYSLIVEGALEIFDGAELEAPTRSGRGVLLHRGAVIHGPAASDGLIVCEEGSAILGPADSSMHVLLFANARVGLPSFGGVHAKGAIGLEPGAEILGGAVAGLGVRGEALRPEPLRAEPVEEAEIPEPERGKRKKRRRRRRKRSADQESDATSELETVRDDQDTPSPAPKRRRRKRRGRKRRSRRKRDTTPDRSTETTDG